MSGEVHGFYGHSGPGSSKKSPLTTAQRNEISRRYAEGETASSLALEFGVSAKVIGGFVPARRPR